MAQKSFYKCTPLLGLGLLIGPCSHFNRFWIQFELLKELAEACEACVSPVNGLSKMRKVLMEEMYCLPTSLRHSMPLESETGLVDEFCCSDIVCEKFQGDGNQFMGVDFHIKEGLERIHAVVAPMSIILHKSAFFHGDELESLLSYCVQDQAYLIKCVGALRIGQLEDKLTEQACQLSSISLNWRDHPPIDVLNCGVARIGKLGNKLPRLFL